MGLGFRRRLRGGSDHFPGQPEHHSHLFGQCHHAFSETEGDHHERLYRLDHQNGYQHSIAGCQLYLFEYHMPWAAGQLYRPDTGQRRWQHPDLGLDLRRPVVGSEQQFDATEPDPFVYHGRHFHGNPDGDQFERVCEHLHSPADHHQCFADGQFHLYERLRRQPDHLHRRIDHPGFDHHRIVCMAVRGRRNVKFPIASAHLFDLRELQRNADHHQLERMHPYSDQAGAGEPEAGCRLLLLAGLLCGQPGELLQPVVCSYRLFRLDPDLAVGLRRRGTHPGHHLPGQPEHHAYLCG